MTSRLPTYDSTLMLVIIHQVRRADYYAAKAPIAEFAREPLPGRSGHGVIWSGGGALLEALGVWIVHTQDLEAIVGINSADCQDLLENSRLASDVGVDLHVGIRR